MVWVLIRGDLHKGYKNLHNFLIFIFAIACNRMHLSDEYLGDLA